jgi:hypothetical protein
LDGFPRPETGTNRASLPRSVVKQPTCPVLRRKPGRSHRDPLLSSVLESQYKNLSSGRLRFGTWLSCFIPNFKTNQRPLGSVEAIAEPERRQGRFEHCMVND